MASVDPSRQQDGAVSAGPPPPGGGSLVPVPGRSPKPPQRPRRRAWPWIGGVLLGAAAVALAVLQPWAPRPAVVAIETVALAPVTRVLAVNGRIAAQHSVDLRPQVAGALTQVGVAEGQTVAAGQVVARIDSAAQDAVVRQAVAALDAALVAQEQADASYRRALALGTNVSAAALDADRLGAQRAMQEVARVAALLEQAQVQLGRHTLRAPIGGTVVDLRVEPGQIVDGATVLMTVADMADLIVEADVDEGHASQIAVGQPAVLRLAGEGQTRTGQVRSVAVRVDAATGGLAVTIGFDTAPEAPIGLTVTANIVVDRRDAALTVPRGALVQTADGTAVLVAAEGVARLRPVSVIDWPAPRLIVTEGLAPGEAVIVDAPAITDGQAVRPGAP